MDWEQQLRKFNLTEQQMKNALLSLTLPSLDLDPHTCDHFRKDGDNYGISCRDCKTVLAGYGYYGTASTCTHVFVKGVCIYCEMLE